MFRVMCYVSCVKCHVSRVMCYLPPVINGNSHSHRPFPPANSPIMHNRLVCHDLKTKTKKIKSKKSLKQKYIYIFIYRSKPILAIFTLTRGIQSTKNQGFHYGKHTRLMDIAYQRLNWPSGPEKPENQQSPKKLYKKTEDKIQ